MEFSTFEGKARRVGQDFEKRAEKKLIGITIYFAFVAAWGTAAAISLFLKVNRHLPATEGYMIGHERWLGAAMEGVTEFAVDAPLLFVQMQIVKVAFPVTELGVKGGVRKLKQVAIVTGGKAKVILFVSVTDEISVRILLPE